MKNDAMAIWKDINVLYRAKENHISRRSRRRARRAFGVFCGEIPLAVYNDETREWMAVDNHRGRSYAARRRLRYCKNKKRDQG